MAGSELAGPKAHSSLLVTGDEWVLFSVWVCACVWEVSFSTFIFVCECVCVSAAPLPRH